VRLSSMECVKKDATMLFDTIYIVKFKISD
jgi:hypothetical protein